MNSIISTYKKANNNIKNQINMTGKNLTRDEEECLIKNAINFAKQHTKISEKDKAIIFHARKSLLVNGQHVWVKKKGGSFDIAMRAFDGAEVCEAIGNFLLYQLSKKL